MAKKINLTVPDDLYEKMQEWKDSFNYSGIFQEAVTRQIRFEEEFQQRLGEDVDMEQIIARLREEKEEAGAVCYRAGRERGLVWAKAASYTDLQRALQDDADITYRTDLGFRERHVDDEIMHNPYWNRVAWLAMESDKMNDEFMRGWQKSVWKFWKKVKDKL